MQQARKFKVSLIGEGGVGKTSFLSRVKDGKFGCIYKPTIGVEVRTLKFSTNYGEIFFDVWDTAGRAECKGLGDGYYIGSDACIAMFDRDSAENVIGEYKFRAPNTPIAICRTKVDLGGSDYSPKLKRSLNSPSKLFQTSAKTGVDCMDPFLWITRELLGKQDLVFN